MNAMRIAQKRKAGKTFLYYCIGCGLAVAAWGFYLLMYAGYQMLGGR
jgi:hypothetical protein